MNIKLFLTAAIALIVGLTACNKEESLSQDGLPVNAVRITASVGNPFATTRSNPVGAVEMQGKFNSGDKILVTKGSDYTHVVYHLDGTTWKPTGNKHHLWANAYESFEARYTANEDNSQIDNYIDYVQNNQSTLENLSKSDLMYCSIEKAPKGEPINFVMERQTSRIIVNIAGFNAEFPAGSKVKDVRVVGKDYNDTYIYIPYAQYPQGEGEIGSNYTMLSRGSGGRKYHITLKVGEKEMRSPNLPDMEWGKSYTFNLIVGKEKLEIGSVSVADWTGSLDLDEDEADEVF